MLRIDIAHTFPLYHLFANRWYSGNVCAISIRNMGSATYLSAAATVSSAGCVKRKRTQLHALAVHQERGVHVGKPAMVVLGLSFSPHTKPPEQRTKQRLVFSELCEAIETERTKPVFLLLGRDHLFEREPR